MKGRGTTMKPKPLVIQVECRGTIISQYGHLFLIRWRWNQSESGGKNVLLLRDKFRGPWNCPWKKVSLDMTSFLWWRHTGSAELLNSSGVAGKSTKCTYIYLLWQLMTYIKKLGRQKGAMFHLSFPRKRGQNLLSTRYFLEISPWMKKLEATPDIEPPLTSS